MKVNEVAPGVKVGFRKADDGSWEQIIIAKVKTEGYDPDNYETKSGTGAKGAWTFNKLFKTYRRTCKVTEPELAALIGPEVSLTMDAIYFENASEEVDI
jgi:hypothetical protein